MEAKKSNPIKVFLHICMGNYLGHHRIFNRFSSI